MPYLLNLLYLISSRSSYPRGSAIKPPDHGTLSSRPRRQAAGRVAHPQLP